MVPIQSLLYGWDPTCSIWLTRKLNALNPVTHRTPPSRPKPQRGPLTGPRCWRCGPFPQQPLNPINPNGPKSYAAPKPYNPNCSTTWSIIPPRTVLRLYSTVRWRVVLCRRVPGQGLLPLCCCSTCCASMSSWISICMYTYTDYRLVCLSGWRSI